jgi:hypothetical protein
MKDQDFFLNTNFILPSVDDYLAYLTEKGWIIRIQHKHQKVSVKIWESEDDKKYGDFMTKVKGESLEVTLIEAFIKIQDYYKRVV